MEAFTQELRLALRKLRERPGFSLFVVLTLGLGIGATTTVVSLANALFLRPAPYAGAERLVAGLSDPRGGAPEDRDMVSYLDYQELAHAGSFDGAAVFSGRWDLTLTGGGEPERVLVSFASSGFFRLLGVQPAAGRLFQAEDDRTPGGPAIVLLSHDLWRRRFGGDPAMVGRSVLLGDVPYTVAGVLPAGFREFANGREPTDLWIPVTMASRTFTAGYLEDRGHRWLTVLARLAPGATLGGAQQDVAGIARRLGETFPQTNEGVGLRLWPLTEYAFGFRDLSRTVLVLSAGAFLVLLIGCINVVNLLLVRSMARSREMAILVALGAPRRRLVGRLLLESMLLALAGGALGTLLSFWAVRSMAAFSPLPVPPYVEVGVDGRVLALALGLSLLTGLVVGLVPAVRGLRSGIREALQQSSRGSSGPGWGLARRLMIVGEVATALMLLVGAGLLIRSFLAFQATDYGFETDGWMIASVRLSNVKHPKLDDIRGFYAPLLERVEGIPGVRGAHLWGPGRAGSSEFYREVFRAGAEAGTAGETCRLYEHRIAAGSPAGSTAGGGGTLAALGIGLVRGRTLEAGDRADAPAAAVVSQSAAEDCWPGRDPIGQRFRRDEDADAPWFTVVGVVRDARHRGRDASAYVPLDIYYSLPQVPTRILTLLVKTDRPPAALGPELRRAVLGLDPDLPLFDLTTMEEVRREEESESRFYAVLMGGYAVVALLLAASGLYSVLAYAISQRTREIGIRMALGARSRDVIRLIGGEALALVAAGLAGGMLAAGLLTRSMAGLLYGISPADLITFVLTPLVFLLVALLASYLPTRRATRVDPLVALDYE